MWALGSPDGRSDPDAFWAAKFLLARYRLARRLSYRNKHVAAATMLAPSVKALLADKELRSKVLERTGWNVDKVMPKNNRAMRRRIGRILGRGGKAKLAKRWQKL